MVLKNKLTNSRCQSQKKLFVLTSLESTRQDLEFCLSTAKEGSAIELPITFVNIRWKSCFSLDNGIIDSGINPVPDNWWYSALLLKDSSSAAKVIFWQIMNALRSLWPWPCFKGNRRAAAIKGDPKVAVSVEMLQDMRKNQNIYLTYYSVPSSLLIFSPVYDFLNSYEPWFIQAGYKLSLAQFFLFIVLFMLLRNM